MAEDGDRTPASLMDQFQDELDDDAFERIFSQFAGPALTVARRILSDPVKAEDAVQETFIRVIRARDQFDPSRDFSPWFYTILRNVCTDMLRSQKRSPEISGQGDLLSNSPSMGDNPPDSPMLKLLDRLSEGNQAVLELRIFHDMRFRDIGAALDISEEAAKKRAQRGLRRLRELYFAHHDSEDSGAPAAASESSGR